MPSLLREVREREGVTQSALSKGTGVSRSNLRGIEIHEINPTIRTIERIAFFLDVDMWELWNMTEKDN
jgi:transcriptional regulator with XRE-family HTH domain